MAWYYGIYSCGHEGRVNVIGKMSERQWKIDRHFEGICEECKNKEREENNKKALEISKKYEFPGLNGTEKQIAWANTIRLDFYQLCNNHKVIMDDIINNELEAKFWIDNRNYFNLDFVEKYHQKENRKQNEKVLISSDAIKPNEVKYDGIVEIVKNGNRIILHYEKNQDFIDIVKSKKYKWNDCWYRELTETTGEFSDRAAEIGNCLLKNGFSICIHDLEITKKTINGEFKVEHTKWIYSVSDTNLLSIRWNSKNDELYNKVKKIGAKWDGSSMKIDVSHYKKVKKFAEENDFKFTKAAISKINNYKEKMNNIKEVDVK